MSDSPEMHAVLRNMLKHGDLSFRDFVEVALYHPEFGYYTGLRSPVGPGGDYVTNPLLSPVFGFTIGKLIDEFLRRVGDVPATFVDIGCGEGTLLSMLHRPGLRLAGVDRSGRGGAFRTIDEVPLDGPAILFSNELFDAFPFARLVRRGEELHELWVTERDGALDWTEHEAAAPYADYFAARGIELQDGQFADISLEWEAYYADLASRLRRGLIVTFDYGFPEKQLFHPRIRRFGTAAAYSQQRVTRDLLANPGGQDLTAHVNFDDLIRAGERAGLRTLYFDRQAKFLLALGATEHELLRPIEDDRGGTEGLSDALTLLDARDAARRLVLPDGIGEDIRVLVQGVGVGDDEWSFQRRLF